MSSDPARSVRIKFCGMRRTQDLREAVALGVDYVGFVLVPGTRRCVAEEEVLRMLEAVDCSRVCRVGVFRDQPIEEIERLVRRLSLDLVQLHGSESPQLAQSVPVPVIRAVPVPPAGSAERFAAPHEIGTLPDRNLHAVLLDTRSRAGDSGGTGELGDPGTIDSLCRDLAGVRVFVAGGLTPANVGRIVRRHQPDAVDVSSGIETRPGEKDAQRMRAFVRAVEEGESA